MKYGDGCDSKMLLFIFLFSSLAISSCRKDHVPCDCHSELTCEVACAKVTNTVVKRVPRRTLKYEEIEIIDERKCNSKHLQNIMLQNMIGETAKEAKIKIMRAAEAQFGGYFNVICASGDFSYITTTTIYCLQSTDDINCYAFLTGNTDQILK